MARMKSKDEGMPTPRPPAKTPEGRENQLIDLAVGLAEKQLLEGTASTPVITHFLRLASTREQKEQKKIELELELLKGKTRDLELSRQSDEGYQKVLDALRLYKGVEPGND